MDGQMNLFDLHEGKTQLAPYEYSFHRHIGQVVRFCGSCVGTLKGRRGTIVNIERYYTEVMTEYGLRIGTPTTIEPVPEDETNDM